MLIKDFVQLAFSSVIGLRMRSFLTALGIAIGIAAVVLLTSIGEGIHRFVLAEFTQFGTNLISIVPGKTTTMGLSGAVLSNVRPLSLDDALALKRIPQIEAIEPVIQGNAEVKANKLSRRTTVFGVGSSVPAVWQIQVAKGRFLPPDDPRTARAFAVLGSKLEQELFANKNALGQRIRIGGERYRVIGVMESKGQILGFDLDDAIYIPAAKSMSMFNRESLMEIDLVYRAGSDASQVADNIKQLLIARHGDEDFTITTQEQMLDTLGNILGILTLAVAALGSISLFVGGVGILTIMTIAVRERTPEVGLLRAIGASRSQILLLFLSEAITLSGIGGVAGLLIGGGGALLLGLAIPALPTQLSWHYILLAELLAVFIGLIAGVAPATRAANLNPVEALRAE
jgi:putative ABC transport system permease protein